MRKPVCSILAAMSLTMVAVSAGAQEYPSSNAREALDHAAELYGKGRYSDALVILDGIRPTDAVMGVDVEFLKAMSRSFIDDDPGVVAGFIDMYPSGRTAEQARLRLADMFFDRGLYDLAAGEYSKVTIRRFPDLSDAYYFKSGYCAFRQDDWAAARSSFSKVASQSDYSDAVTYLTAFMSYSEGDYVSAREGFMKVRDVYPTMVPYYLLQMAFNEKDYRYVVDNYKETLESADGERLLETERIVAESWFNLDNWSGAVELLNDFSNQGGEMGREEYYMLGYAYYMLSDWSDAERNLSKAAGPDDALSQNASYHLADCYLHLGDNERAMQSFSIASSSGFDAEIREDALFNYGKMKYASGGGVFDEAINVLGRYVEQYPSSERYSEAMEYLIAAYYNSSNYDAAYKAIKSYPNPDNDMKTALQKIAYFHGLQSLSENDLTGASKYLEEAGAYRYSNRYTALSKFWLAETLYRQERYADAARGFEEFIRVSPSTEMENPYAYYNAAYCYYNDDSLSEALRRFEAFTNRADAPQRFKADAYNRLGDITMSQRSFWAAIGWYDKAVAAGTEERYYAAYRRAVALGMLDRPERKIESLRDIIAGGEGDWVDDARYELARTYMQQGSYSKAAGELEEYIGLYPASENRTQALSDLGLAYRNLGKDETALDFYKQAAVASLGSEQAKDALSEIRDIYVTMNDVDGYYRFATDNGLESDANAIQRDSLSWAAANRLYISGDGSALTAIRNYLGNYPKGNYRAQALYYASESCASSEPGSAIGYLKDLAAMPSNDYTVRGLQRLSSLAYSQGEYATAAAASLRLGHSASTRQERQSALADYVQALYMAGDGSKTVIGLDALLAEDIDQSVSDQARFYKALALDGLGRKDEAVALFSQLSSLDASTTPGAESMYKVIEHAYSTGASDRAEELIYQMADKKGVQAYWLARAFIILGDIYRDSGDSFQARATYQSIVDGYSNTTDDVVRIARDRIDNLK